MEALRNISTNSTSQILEPSAIKYHQHATSTTNHLHSLAADDSMVGNFLEFCCSSIELLYRGLTSIIYMPLSCLIELYKLVLSYNRDKFYVPASHKSKSLSVKIPLATLEKKKEFAEIIEHVFPSLNDYFWNSHKVGKKYSLIFLSHLDYFLDSFDKQLKQLNIPKPYLLAYVLGSPYSLETNRKEFLKKCLNDHFENPNNITLQEDHFDIYGECYGYIPSFIGWIDSWSCNMRLKGDYEGDGNISVYLSKSPHWTLKNAAAHCKKEAKRHLPEKPKEIVISGRVIF